VSEGREKATKKNSRKYFILGLRVAILQGMYVEIIQIGSLWVFLEVARHVCV
jgi:hypothetical protein